MVTFEEELMDLIDKHQERGASYGELISALELRIMALQEEEDGEQADESVL